MRHFLAYWKPNQIPLMVGKPLDHAGSAQFRRVSPGDVVWIVTVHDGRLKLLGRIWVTDVVSRKNAIKRFGDAYDAPLHIVASPQTVLTTVEIDIQHLADQLEFESAKHSKLSLEDADHTDGKQLQALRRLTYGSAMMLARELGEREEEYSQDNGSRRNPAWSRDEVILALDTYFRHNPSHIHQNHPAVVELSDTLRIAAGQADSI